MDALTMDSALAGLAGLARCLLAAPFLLSALLKLHDWSCGLDEVRDLSLPMPALALVATVTLQLGGGLMLVLGWQVRWAAAALAAFTLMASVLAHPFWRVRGWQRQHHRMTFAEHLAIVGGLLWVVAHG